VIGKHIIQCADCRNTLFVNRNQSGGLHFVDAVWPNDGLMLHLSAANSSKCSAVCQQAKSNIQPAHSVAVQYKPNLSWSTYPLPSTTMAIHRTFCGFCTILPVAHVTQILY